MKHSHDAIVLSVDCHIRRYTYRAFLNRKTGRLLRIEAGCRTWHSFTEAKNHYNGLGLNPEFASSNIADVLKIRLWDGVMIYAQRWEAREVLRKLERKVAKRQRYIKSRA